MKCLKSCAAYNAWLAPETDWQAPNPCAACDHEQEYAKPEGLTND